MTGWRLVRLIAPLIAVLLTTVSYAGYLTGDAARALRAAAEGDRIKVIVVMSEPTEATLAASRPQEVGARLKALAARTQASLLADAGDLQAAGEAGSSLPLPIINGVALTATKRAVSRIAARLDVAYVCLDGLNFIQPVGPPGPAMRRLTSVPWALTSIRAEEAWNAFGLRGEGVVVANLDTGVYVQHAALAANYRGGTNSFFDAVNSQANPYDDHGHGTGTMGDVCGNAPGDSFYGVAPNATFIAAKCFNSSGSGSDSQILACADWTLDPDGNPATDDAPDVVSNSWGGGSRDPWFRSAVDAWVAASIYPVFSIGNSGPGAGSANSPGDYLDVLGVGATDSGNVIASFSSRGPATWGGIPYLKPNVVAPGKAVDVPLRTGGYGTANGTSFACPLTAGAAALIIQQRGPVVTTKTGIAGITKNELNALLENTAADLGPGGPDNAYGHGIISVYDALAAAVPELEWVGTGAFASDGVSPDQGSPTGSASPTTFTFRVRYRDLTGASPQAAACWVQSRGPGKAWASEVRVPMTLRSADVASGAVFEGTAQLPNKVLKYRFNFRGAHGAAATGAPAAYTQGPLMKGVPHLLWSGRPGFEADGVSPDAGAAGTVFQFQVLYTDSHGDPPTTMQVQIRRNGKLYRQKALAAAPSGDYRLGTLYRTWVPLNHPGTYEYRFAFADATGAAEGAPTDWQSAPAVTGLGAALVASLAVVPTQTGAQVSLALAGAANVTATVVNAAGRPIRTIIADRPLGAGLQTLVWDGKAESGLASPAGLYLIRVTAKSADGGQSTALATVGLW
ncbi:MAG: hypothetical protein FJX75_05175 [Armatimonadetes bacterium]|nr:hypothetical protein [Armatimonadota bacterium]